jgi:hypothetical protein
MIGRFDPRYPGAFDGDAGVLSEIDYALVLIGGAHWLAPFSMGSKAKRRTTKDEPEAEEAQPSTGFR